VVPLPVIDRMRPAVMGGPPSPGYPRMHRADPALGDRARPGGRGVRRARRGAGQGGTAPVAKPRARPDPALLRFGAVRAGGGVSAAEGTGRLAGTWQTAGVTAAEPTIVASSIGFWPTGRGPWDWRPGPIFDFLFQLAGGPAQPRLCFIATASGDSVVQLHGVYGAFAGSDVRVSHLALFAMPNVADVRAHLLAQDVIWVGGGSVANLLAVWRVHGLDGLLRDAWQAGVVLGGVSAGSLCWHVGGTTDSFGPALRPVTGGLGFLPYSNGVHYDSEAERRLLYHRLVGQGVLPAGYATDDGAALVYRGERLAEVVADRTGAAGYAVSLGPDETVVEERIEPRLLPGFGEAEDLAR
jgi:peptidase E